MKTVRHDGPVRTITMRATRSDAQGGFRLPRLGQGQRSLTVVADSVGVQPSAFADELGLDPDEYAACREDGTEDEAVERDIAAGKDRSFNGTPTFLIGGGGEDSEWYTIVGARPAAYFGDIIDALLAGDAPPAERGQDTLKLDKHRHRHRPARLALGLRPALQRARV